MQKYLIGIAILLLGVFLWQSRPEPRIESVNTIDIEPDAPYSEMNLDIPTPPEGKIAVYMRREKAWLYSAVVTDSDGSLRHYIPSGYGGLSVEVYDARGVRTKLEKLTDASLYKPEHDAIRDLYKEHENPLDSWIPTYQKIIITDPFFEAL